MHCSLFKKLLKSYFLFFPHFKFQLKYHLLIEGFLNNSRKRWIFLLATSFSTSNPQNLLFLYYSKPHLIAFFIHLSLFPSSSRNSSSSLRQKCLPYGLAYFWINIWINIWPKIHYKLLSKLSNESVFSLVVQFRAWPFGLLGLPALPLPPCPVLWEALASRQVFTSQKDSSQFLCHSRLDCFICKVAFHIGKLSNYFIISQIFHKSKNLMLTSWLV